MAESECLIAFGANQGDREQMLVRAIAALGERGLRDCRVSRLYRTDPIGGPAVQEEYVNAVIRAKCSDSAGALVEQLLAVEAACGRRRGERWAPRTIDLDLLLLDRQVVDLPTVQLPHPRMTCRRFVLEPACEVAAELRHPWSGATLAELAQAISGAVPRTAVWLWPEGSARQSGLAVTLLERELEQRGIAAQFRWLEPGNLERFTPGPGVAAGPAGDWHILLVQDPLQLNRLRFAPGLVAGWARPPAGCSASGNDQARRVAQEHVGAVVLLVPELTEAVRELSAALQAVGEFWSSPGLSPF